MKPKKLRCATLFLDSMKGLPYFHNSKNGKVNCCESSCCESVNQKQRHTKRDKVKYFTIYYERSWKDVAKTQAMIRLYFTIQKT